MKKDINNKEIGDEKKINIKSFRGLLRNIKEKPLKEILKKSHKKGLKLFEDNSKKKFNSQKELREFVIEEIVMFFNNQLNSFKERVSDLEKKGEDISVISMKLMAAPLKIKNFNATSEKNDFDKVIEILENIDEELEKEEKSLKRKSSKNKKGKKGKKSNKKDKQDKELEDAVNSFREIKKELSGIKKGSKKK